MSMVRKAGLLVGVIGAAATVAGTAEGGEGGWGRKVWVPYYAAPPVVYAPRPAVVYAPPPVAYVPAYPVVPVYPAYPAPGLNLNLNLPLR